MLKRVLSIALTVVLLAGSIGYPAEAAKKAKCSFTKVNLEVGQKKQIKIKNKVKKAKYTFSSSKKSVAKVTKKGVIKAVSEGKSKITVKEVVKGKKAKKIGTVKVTVLGAKNNAPTAVPVTMAPVPTTPAVLPTDYPPVITPEPTEEPSPDPYTTHVMSIYVKENANKVYTVNGSTCDVTMQYFSAEIDGDYFTGTTAGNSTGGEGSVVIKDYKEDYNNGEKQYCARYIVEGTDNTGAHCKMFIEDNGLEYENGSILTKPIIITNSQSLSWLGSADLSGRVSEYDGGKVIDIMWNESNTTPVTPAPVVRPDNTKNYNRELFVFNVSVGGSWGVESSYANSSMIHFNVESNCANFRGNGVDPDWGFVDTRKQFPGQVQTLSARYILEGTDVNGDPCKIYVENNGIDDNGMVTEPTIITDSPEYAWIETAPLHGTVSWGAKLNIHMWTTSN